MRTAAAGAILIPLLTALPTMEARAQGVDLSLSVAAGSAFDGVAFGMHVGSYDASPLFAEASFGVGVDTYHGGVAYHEAHPTTYAGWGRLYRGDWRRGPSYSCWDHYWDSYWDPWNDWYYDCVVVGPYWARSFRAHRWQARYGYYGYRGYRSAHVYAGDPYYGSWRSYRAYDPWGSYWGGYWDGYRDGYYDGWGRGWYPARVRTVYVAGGRTGTVVYRPSPLAVAGPSYKESPRGPMTRTAVRRGAEPAASSGGRVATGRTAAPRASGRTLDRGAAESGRVRAAAPLRPSDRLRAPTASRRRATATTNRPEARSRGAVGAPTARGGASGPSARASDRSTSRPEARAERTRFRSLNPPRPSASRDRAGSAATGSRAPAQSRPSARLRAPARSPASAAPSRSGARPSAAPRGARGRASASGRPIPSARRPPPRATPRNGPSATPRPGGSRPSAGSRPSGARAPSVGARPSGGSRPSARPPSRGSSRPSARPRRPTRRPGG